MGSNPSPNGRSPHQGESRHYRAKENPENWVFENSRVEEGESLYNRRRAPAQEQKSSSHTTTKEERRGEPVNPSSIIYFIVILIKYYLYSFMSEEEGILLNKINYVLLNV